MRSSHYSPSGTCCPSRWHRLERAEGAAAAPGRAAILLLLLAFSAWWLFATVDLARAPAWNLRARRLDGSGEMGIQVTRDELDLSRHAADPLAEEVRVEATDAGLLVSVPGAMLVTRSDWLLKVSCSETARRESAHPIDLSVNGKTVANGLRAEKDLAFSIAAADLGPGDNTFELTAPIPGAFRRIGLRNHVSFHDWYPMGSVLRIRGSYLRDPLDLAALAGALAAGAALLLGLHLVAQRRLGVPLFTRRQWRWTVAPLVVVAGGLAIRNLFWNDKLLLGQWSMASLVLGYLVAAGLWCAWRSFRAERWSEVDEASRARIAEARHAVLLFLAIWLVYNSNMARVGMVDCTPPPHMAVSLLRSGNLDLDEYAGSYMKWDRKIGLVQARGHWVSRWPPGTALFCLPFFALPVALRLEVPSVAEDVLAKLTASTLTALSAVFVYLCLRRLASRSGATWLTVAYALGTAAFHISAQDTWSHGPVQLCLAAALYIAISEPSRREWHVLAGLLVGLMIAARPQSAALALPLLLWVAYRSGAGVGLWYALGGLAPALFLIGYDAHYFGTLGPGGYRKIVGGGWHLAGLPTALLGLLASPNRGALIFSPFLAFCIYGALVGLRHRERRLRTLALALAVGVAAHFLLTASWRAWHAVLSYGSRYSADAMPFLVFLGGFAIDRIRGRPLSRWLFATTVALGILIHSLAVYWDVRPWNQLVMEQEQLRIRDFERAAWVTDPPQILWQARFALGLLDEE